MPHLGDGVTSEHYFPIVEYLRQNPGSLNKTNEVRELESRILQHNRKLKHLNSVAANKGKERNDWMKPPSAEIIESEFSHLLGAIARDNKILGAVIYDNFGLKVASAGNDIFPLFLTEALRARIEEEAAKKLPTAVPCAHFVREGIESEKKCDSEYAVFMQVIDRSGKQWLRVGYSAIFVDATYYDKK